MRKIKDEVKIENIVTIEVVDRKTGKVVMRKQGKNVILWSGATELLEAVIGSPVGAWSHLNIFNPDKIYIKSVTGSFGDILGGLGYYYVQFTAQDSSTDSYTTRYFGLASVNQADWVRQNVAYDYGSSVTKGADQTLKVTWEIRVPFSTPP